MYLFILGTLLSIVDPEGLAWTLATAAAAIGVGTAVLLLVKRAERRSFTTVLGRNNDTSGGWPSFPHESLHERPATDP